MTARRPLALATAALALLASGVARPAARGPEPYAGPSPLFRDFGPGSGIDFVHANGAEGNKNYYEIMGSGACLFDADGDGRLDIYFVTSVGPNRLYRGRGDLKFEDVTEAAGVGDTGYGMGVVAGDVDRDGDADLYVTNFGPNVLYRNEGNGTFTDVSREAGVTDSLWGCGAVFFDADGDGFLDLYVANYKIVAVPDTVVCRAEHLDLRLYCPPHRYPPAPDVFYRNRGDGTFENATGPSGIGEQIGAGLGALSTDYDDDGHPDLYVANDLDPNFLLRNRGDGTFEELGVLAGASHSEDGKAMGAMGVISIDYDNDGRIDLFSSNYLNEMNTLYHNEGEGWFLDASATSGLGGPSIPYVGWGSHFLDFDGDGWADHIVVNGHTESDAERVDDTTTYRQPDFLFRNVGGGRFADVTAAWAPLLSEPRAGRGAAFGDLDDDGDTDIVVVNQNDSPLLLENLGVPSNHWIGIGVQGTVSNPEGIGARVGVHAGDLEVVREVQSGSSYLSGSDLRILVGVGTRTAVDSVTVRWPSGRARTIVAPALDRYHDIVEP